MELKYNKVEPAELLVAAKEQREMKERVEQTEKLREELINLVEIAWNNGIIDYAQRLTEDEKAIVLSTTGGKIKDDVPTIAGQILLACKKAGLWFIVPSGNPALAPDIKEIET